MSIAFWIVIIIAVFVSEISVYLIYFYEKKNKKCIYVEENYCS